MTKSVSGDIKANVCGSWMHLSRGEGQILREGVACIFITTFCECACGSKGSLMVRGIPPLWIKECASSDILISISNDMSMYFTSSAFLLQTILHWLPSYSWKSHFIMLFYCSTYLFVVVFFYQSLFYVTKTYFIWKHGEILYSWHTSVT